VLLSSQVSESKALTSDLIQFIRRGVQLVQHVFVTVGLLPDRFAKHLDRDPGLSAAKLNPPSVGPVSGSIHHRPAPFTRLANAPRMAFVQLRPLLVPAHHMNARSHRKLSGESLLHCERASQATIRVHVGERSDS
jgi:hypothetical protein